jgi:hypothetical protein
MIQKQTGRDIGVRRIEIIPAGISKINLSKIAGEVQFKKPIATISSRRSVERALVEIVNEG